MSNPDNILLDKLFSTPAISSFRSYNDAITYRFALFFLSEIKDSENYHTQMWNTEKHNGRWMEDFKWWKPT